MVRLFSRHAAVGALLGRALCLLLVLAGGARGQSPFRLDEIDGRDYEFNTDYFLNVFSFRYPLPWRQAWREARNGFRGLAGSIRTDEFYIFQEMKLNYDLDANHRFRFFQEQKEDFDSRYRRIEIGLQRKILHPGPVRAGIFIEALADKVENDVGFEVTYGDHPTGIGRIAFTLVDVLYNKKGEEPRRYSRFPYTLDVEGWVPIGERLVLGGGIHHNFPLRLKLRDRGMHFTYRKNYSEIFLEYRLTRRSILSLRGWIEDSLIGRNFFTGTSDRDLDRFAHFGEIEYRHRFDSGTEVFGGLWTFGLSEENRAPLEPTQAVSLLRREEYLFAGTAWPLPRGFTLHPMVMLGWTNNVERFPVDSNRKIDKDRGVQSKVNLGFEYTFSPKASLIVNPTFDLDHLRFGGGLAQFQLVF